MNPLRGVLRYSASLAGLLLGIWLAAALMLHDVLPGFALLGFGVGSWWDADNRRSRREPGERLRRHYVAALAAACGRLAKADGHVDADELAVVERFFVTQKLSAAERRQAIAWFEHGKADRQIVLLVYRGFERFCSGRGPLLRTASGILADLVLSDGTLTDEERLALFRVANELGCPLAYVEETLRERQPQPSDTRLNWRRAAQQVGVQWPCSRDKLVAAYRRQVARRHPDRLIARGADADAIALANDEVQQLRRAYEFLLELLNE
ncbi:TerB family tellurite resistance protein [Gammaproteobacteria bacterium]|nr:TerB family tellurite resistance protein [Gammaproteobacteria bacterium]